MKRSLDDDFISPVKHFHGDVTCLFDLSNEILLMICRYLSIYDIFHCFYTPDKPEYRLHCLINDYYTKLNIDGMKLHEFNYFIKLFRDFSNPLRPLSLKLSNSSASFLIEHYFRYFVNNVIGSIFSHLINLSLFDCSSQDLYYIDVCYQSLTKLEYLHLTITDNQHFPFEEKFDILMNRILFQNSSLSTLHRIHIESSNGLSLYKSLIPHQNLRYVYIHLRTIDDLYLLLNGLIPNIEILIVQLNKSRLSKCDLNISKYLCSKLIDFTLLDNSTLLVVDNIQSIFNLMPDLNKLTLSIRDTNDPSFCHGQNFESILNKSLPNLRQFNYTMTHRITEETIIDDFLQWPMNSIKYENRKCIHIYSLPWPSSRDDQRKLPLIDGKSIIPVTSDVNIKQNSRLIISSSIKIKFSERITRLILNKETPVGSLKSIEQSSIRHLIVKRRLINENEIFIIHYQYPNVKYLELLFPLTKERFFCCFKTLFRINNPNGKRYYWDKLIHFRTNYTFSQAGFFTEERFHHWLTSDTDLKFHSNYFIVNTASPFLSIWF